MKNIVIIALIITLYATCNNHKKPQDDYLILKYDENYEKMWYQDKKGNIVIEHDKYIYLFTDTFKTMAIVITKENKCIAINRQLEQLFEVYIMDNGPDYVSEGLFRIVKDDKIGFADETGKIVIEPQYKCAFAFEDGKAQVAFECTTTMMGEYGIWNSDQWFFIDKNGNKIP